MIVLGLTGSLGTGKSTALSILSELGYPTENADTIVHELLAHNQKVIDAIGQLWPKAIVKGRVNLSPLRSFFDEDPQALTTLEDILHPFVFEALKTRVEVYRQQNHSLIALEVPLLYETGAHQWLVDVVAVTHLSASLQRRRALSRPGMTLSRYNAILQRQLPSLDKIKRADYVLYTCQTKEKLALQILSMIKEIISKSS